MPAGLSLRRFARVFIAPPGPPSVVARIEAPEDPAGRPGGAAPEPPQEPIRALLERAGLPVPRRLGGDVGAGIDLLEDAGRVPLLDAAVRRSPNDRSALYRE